MPWPYKARLIKFLGLYTPLTAAIIAFSHSQMELFDLIIFDCQLEIYGICNCQLRLMQTKVVFMAGGWSRDGAVQDQIDASVDDAIQQARSRLPKGESLSHCEECDG